MRLSSERVSSWCVPAAFGFAVVTLLVPALRAGVWDPFELRTLELARRIALGLFGASGFEIPGAENALPTRGELDRGELPFTSMAFALRLFGLHPWAARLALVAWAVIALIAIYVLLSRLVDRVAAAFGVLLLASVPLFFVQARTLLGDGVTMGALALALAGLTLALYDRGSIALRSGFFAVGCLGLVAGGLSRGLLLGVAVPALGAAGAYWVQRLSGAVPSERASTIFAGLSSAMGLGSCAFGTVVLARAVAEPEHYFPWLGFGLVSGGTRPTFDVIVQSLGHGLFPLSAFLPVAFARLLLAPPGVGGAERTRELGLRASALLTATLGFGMATFLADAAGVIAFGPVASLAVVAALALHDVNRGAPASPAAGMIVAALLVILFLDFHNLPDKTLSAFCVDSARFPESFRAIGEPWLLAAALLSALLVALAFLERDEPGAPAFAGRDYLVWPAAVRDLWNGNLLFGACVIEAALLGFLAFDLLGERVPALQRFAAGSELSRLLSRVAWLAMPALFVAPFLALVARDLLRLLARLREGSRFGALLPRRGTLALIGFVASGSALGLAYYPALAAQLSPREAFDAYRTFARPGEPIGIVGSSPAAGFYAAGRGASVFETAEQGYEWLVQPGPRRFLVFRSDALAGLTARYRESAEPRANLPILTARSSEVLLASNRLRAGERNENALERYLLTSPPRIGRPLDANLGDQLDVLGWDVLDAAGQSVRSVTPGRSYEFVIYFRVVSRIPSTWETFIHIDGFQRRFNGDHTTVDGQYPFSLWRKGDVIADRRAVALEPNFGAGEYRVFIGLYSGTRRMPVQRGAASEDRIEAGTLIVE